MKMLNKKFVIQGEVGLEVSLSEAVDQGDGVQCDKGNCYYINDMTEVLFKGKPVKLSDIKLRLYASEDQTDDIISDALRYANLTIADTAKTKKGAK